VRISWALLICAAAFGAEWPQAAGPHGNWKIAGPAAPVSWSVTLNRNIVSRVTLPNAGQSGIAVWGDRIFLTTFDTYTAGEPKFSAKILGHAIDARSGKILWSVKLEGSVKSPMLYAYSDSTTPSPITDGEYVWFFNASGEMGCWNFAGKQLWKRQYKPWREPYPFNKQHEPILYRDTIVSLEPLDGNPPEKAGWNYLRGIDKQTGKTLWVAEDGTTAYCTSVFGMLGGKPAVLNGRGGWHDVPERPVGLSLMSLAAGEAGKTIWRYIAGDGTVAGPTWQALYTMHWDERYAYWFRLNPEESHLVFDSRTGKLLREQSLVAKVDYRQWDPATGKHIVHSGVNLRDMRELSPRNKLADGEVIRVHPAWHANMVMNGYHYFLTSTAHRRNRVPPKGRAGPSHCIARVNVETGKVEYLEVPVTVERAEGRLERRVYGVAVKTKPENAQGVDVAAEERSRTDGWEVPAFWGSPTAVNDVVYFTTMLGITYAVDSKAKVLDETALLGIGDLGPSGETWSLNSISYKDGRLYHRSAKELVVIGR
jgi:outer membrane protein assembly factor BamB